MDQDIMKAIWIDGFLPSINTMERIREKYLEIDDSVYLRKRPYLEYSNDEIFKRLAHVIRRDYEKKIEKKTKDIDLFHHCDLFLMQFAPTHSANFKSRGPLLGHDLQLSETFKNEVAKEDNKKNYRQIIVTFSPYCCDVGDQCTQQLIEKLNFKIKIPKEYENFPKFKEDCKNFLGRYFLEPYIAPCMVAEEKLNLLGFEVKEPDV